MTNFQKFLEDATVISLVKIILDPNTSRGSRKREMAIAGLHRFKENVTVADLEPLLEAFLNSQSQEVRHNISRALRSFAPLILDFLAENLHNADADIREASAKTLSGISNQQTLRILTKTFIELAFNDNSSKVRAEVIKQLGLIAHLEVLANTRQLPEEVELV